MTVAKVDVEFLRSSRWDDASKIYRTTTYIRLVDSVSNTTLFEVALTAEELVALLGGSQVTVDGFVQGADLLARVGKVMAVRMVNLASLGGLQDYGRDEQMLWLKRSANGVREIVSAWAVEVRRTNFGYVVVFRSWVDPLEGDDGAELARTQEEERLRRMLERNMPENWEGFNGARPLVAS